nr:hypothetical protein BaRGS_006907 [Batillaria attramentaria]
MVEERLRRAPPVFNYVDHDKLWGWRVVLDAGFLRVCPLQPHFLRRICLATGRIFEFESLPLEKRGAVAWKNAN